MEEKFKEIFEKSPIGIAFFDKEGKLTDANQSALEIGGFTSLNDAIGFNIFNAVDMGSKKDELLEKGHIKFQTPVNFDNVKKLGIYNTTMSGTGFIDLTISVIASGFLAQIQNITEQKKAEERFRKEVKRESSLLELYKKAPQLTDKELYGRALDLTVRLTDSTIGFFHKISDDQKNIILTAWNNEAWNNCKASFKNHYPIEESGNWTDCIQAKHPIVYNDYENSPNRKGFPKGHTPVKRFISTPVFDEDKVKLIFGVGNKIEEYNDQDVIQIQSVANELYRIIKQRQSAQALKEAHNNLEKKVQERTVEINQKNKILDGINAIFRAAVTNHEKEFGRICLDVCENLTGSAFSFMGEINEHNKFDSIAVSERGWKACKMVKEQGAESVNDNVIRGIRSRAIEEKEILIFNDPTNSPHWSGLPEGHYQIISFLGAPLIYRGEVIGLIALANKKEGYSQEDIAIMEIITIAITESLMHYKALNQLEESQNELKQTITKLESSNMELQQFAYVASHDLQEPLRTIASFTQLLERRYKGKFDSDADEFMDYIVEAAVRMKEQIEGLLEYSRVGTRGEEFQPVDMNEILKLTTKVLNTLIEESKAKITFDDLPKVSGDADQLQRVFQNLISNAIKFKKSEEPSLIHISSTKDRENNEHIFSVSDNGIGIEKQYSERIFTIFQRLHTREKYKGTGIGLSIVKRIIERHGGRIWVESDFGKGSTFYFTIPVLDK